MKLDVNDRETVRWLFDLQKRNALFFEEVINGVYTEILRPGDSAVDGGAHKGLHTYPMAECVGKSGKVHAYEVIPKLVAEMRTRIKETPLPQVILHDLALSDQIGETSFNWVKNAPGLSGLKQRDYPIEPDIELLRVETTKIDLLAPEDLDHWRVCKLDLEGGEFGALLGAREYLRRHHPVILFEHGDRAASFYTYSIEAMVEFFEELKYRTFDLFGRPFSRTERGAQQVPWYLIAVEDKSPDHDFVLNRFPALFEEIVFKRLEHDGKSLRGMIEPVSVLIAKATANADFVFLPGVGKSGLRPRFLRRCDLVIPVSDDRAIIRLGDAAPDTPSSGTTGGYSIRVPDALEMVASGNRIRLVVVARTESGNPTQARFAVAYSTNEVGTSGWQWHAAGPDWGVYETVWDVPPMKEGCGDFIGLLPDESGKPGIDICAVAVTVLRASGAKVSAGTVEKQLARQLVFVHIPKTAGLSLHTALESIYGKESTLRIGNEDELQNMRKLPNDRVIDKNFLSGHFFYNDVKSRCRPDAMMISILRDPVTRILSNYNYVCNWDEHPLHEETVRQSFSEHVYKNRHFLRGLCCRQLSGVPECDAAIEIVQSRYALVGTTEHLPAFITSLSRIIGKKIVEERTNVSGGQGPKIDLSSELCEVLLEITEEDRKLFDFLKALPDGLFEGSASKG